MWFSALIELYLFYFWPMNFILVTLPCVKIVNLEWFNFVRMQRLSGYCSSLLRQLICVKPCLSVRTCIPHNTFYNNYSIHWNDRMHISSLSVGSTCCVREKERMHIYTKHESYFHHVLALDLDLIHTLFLTILVKFVFISPYSSFH